MPIGISERQLRTYFESAGHIIGLRLIQPQQGKDSQFGFVDFLDPSSATDAVSQLDGLELGGKRLKVSLAAQGRKRDRQDKKGDAAVVAGGDDGEAVMSGPPFALPRGYQNPILGNDNPVDACLIQMPQVELYEAVEQLRLLALERPTEAALLLEAYPQLRVAVVTILQQAGKIPMGPLPTNALVSLAERNELNSATPAAAPAAASAPASVPDMDDETRRTVEQILESLPPEKVERLLTMTDADVGKIPDLNQRRQVTLLRQHLIPLLNEGK